MIISITAISKCVDYISDVEWVFVYDDLSKWSEFLGSKVCVLSIPNMLCELILMSVECIT